MNVAEVLQDYANAEQRKAAALEEIKIVAEDFTHEVVGLLSDALDRLDKILERLGGSA